MLEVIFMGFVAQAAGDIFEGFAPRITSVKNLRKGRKLSQ